MVAFAYACAIRLFIADAHEIIGVALEFKDTDSLLCATTAGERAS